MSEIKLKRYPHIPHDPLQAWDSADELLIQHLKSVPLPKKRILILNDQFGAISCPLKEFNITSYTDSFVSAKAISINSGEKVHPIHALSELSDVYDVALIHLPKNMSYFEDLLTHLSQHLHRDSKVIVAGMVKYIPNSCFELLHRYIGETKTSLAVKKARLIFADFQRKGVPSPYPLQILFDGFTKPFLNHSNLFSREKLDIGTRFLLEHIPQGNYPTILDLGCANGIVGMVAKKVNPKSKIIFSDESAMAIESAQANYTSHFSDEAEFVWTNCYEGRAPNSIDLVLCNPPFHQQTTIGDHIALQMFKDAHHALKMGGKIRVIGNSHLGYQLTLKKIFGNSEVIASNAKFMIVDSIKQKI